MRTYKIIDSFNVNEKIRSEVGGLTNGWWFVVEGNCTSEESRPQAGRRAIIEKPSGEKADSYVIASELRHGTLAIQFAGIDGTDIPRLSVVSIHL